MKQPIAMRFDKELLKFLKEYAAVHKTNVTQVVTDLVVSLKLNCEKGQGRQYPFITNAKREK